MPIAGGTIGIDQGTSSTLSDSYLANQTAIWSVWTYDSSVTNNTSTWSSWVIGSDQSPLSTTLSNYQLQGEQRIQEQAGKRDRPSNLRAYKLLKAILTSDEWEGYLQHACVRLETEKFFYDIGIGWTGMTYQINKATGEVVQKLCCHPSTSFEAGDRIAAVYLAIKTNEEEFLRKANQHYLRSDEKSHKRNAHLIHFKEDDWKETAKWLREAA